MSPVSPVEEAAEEATEAVASRTCFAKKVEAVAKKPRGVSVPLRRRRGEVVREDVDLELELKSESESESKSEPASLSEASASARANIWPR